MELLPELRKDGAEMSDKRTKDHYAYLDDVDRFANVPSWRDEHEEDIEPWYERFYDECDSYEPRDEVER